MARPPRAPWSARVGAIVPERLAVVSVHTSPLVQPGGGDSGGMNVYVRELAGALARRGVDVDVYVRRAATEDPEVVEVEPGLRVVHLDAGPPSLPKEDLPAILALFTDRLVDRLGDDPPDVLHANYWLSGVVAHDVKHRLEIPLAMTFHTLGEVKRRTGDDEPAARIEAEQRIVGCADLLLANGAPERDQLVALYGADRGRIEIISPGVDRAIFSPGDVDGARRALGLGPEPLVLFVGRIQPLKGLDVAVGALAAVADPTTRLCVVGGPSGHDGLEALAEVEALAGRLGVTERIDWHPPQPHHLLSTYYRAADVVVMPSRSESFGLVALEAAACGVPVVATAVGGLREVVDDAITGLLIEQRTPEAFAAGIDRVLGDALTADRMGLAASVRADTTTWRAAAERLDARLGELADRRLVPCG